MPGDDRRHPSDYSDEELLQKIAKEKAELKKQIAALFLRWAELDRTERFLKGE
jgi:hypothetical protein